MAIATTLLVGTTKGLFLLTADQVREHWHVSGPHCDLWTINHTVGDPGTDRIWAGGGTAWSGAGVWMSDDAGKSWEFSKFTGGESDAWARDNPEEAAVFGMTPAPAGPFEGEIDAIWSVAYAHDTLYAGSKPANLYQSKDGGTTWERFEGLVQFPGREDWNPGAAGLTLHTIVPHPEDPERLWVGISAAGVFATDNMGQSWDHRIRRDNRVTEGASLHPAFGSETEIGGCVHNMQIARSDGGYILYQQNHHGVYRSLDGARSWQDITNGLPSTFGFPIAVHPHNAHMIWTFPLNGDSVGRYPPNASAAMWRSSDGGDTWSAQSTGLPTENCFFTVLRQSMTVDSWSEIARHLPTVLCVEAVTHAG